VDDHNFFLHVSVHFSEIGSKGMRTAQLFGDTVIIDSYTNNWFAFATIGSKLSFFNRIIPFSSGVSVFQRVRKTTLNLSLVEKHSS